MEYLFFPLFRLKDQNLIKDNKPKDILESSSDSEEKIPAAKPLSAPKRKLELEGETVEKKKKGRPRKDSRLVPVTLTVQVKEITITLPLSVHLMKSVPR